jgi:excisionase family DNA binding protein
METNSNGRGSGLIRLKPAAARLGVNVRTLYREIADGKLTLVHVRGCSCIEETELENYIQKCKGGKKHD